MSFIEHLGELRVRLIRITISLLVTLIIGWIMSGYLFEALKWPLDHGMKMYEDSVIAEAPKDAAGQPIVPPGTLQKVEWVTKSPTTAFIVQMRLAMYFALLASFPVFLYQVCAFIFPGLKTGERQLIMVILGGGSFLAIFGTATAYGGVLPFVMPYLLQYTPADVKIQLELTETLSFILTLLVGFGVAFQFPMFVLAGVALGIVETRTLTQHWRVAIVAIALVSAVLTPPDVISMSAMMAPLLLLYGFSIIIAMIATARRKKKEEPTTDITTT